jgi:hypothetical protein
MTQTALFELPRWGAGDDPDTRAQHNQIVDKLEALGVRVAVGHFNARPAAGGQPSKRFIYITDDLPFPGAMYQDPGVAGQPWIPLNGPDLTAYTAYAPVVQLSNGTVLAPAIAAGFFKAVGKTLQLNIHIHDPGTGGVLGWGYRVFLPPGFNFVELFRMGKSSSGSIITDQAPHDIYLYGAVEVA